MKDTTEIRSNVNDAVVHTVRHSEQFAFTKWINQLVFYLKFIFLFKLFLFSNFFFIILSRNLAKDKELSLATNPINPETNDLYIRCKDGYLLW